MFGRRKKRPASPEFSTPLLRLVATVLEYVEATKPEIPKSAQEAGGDAWVSDGGHLMASIRFAADGAAEVLLTVYPKGDAPAIKLHYARLGADGSIESGPAP